MSKKAKLTAKTNGFTLIELLVVISIIALLSALIFSAITKARSKARDARRTADLNQVQTALEIYQNDHASYPVTASSTKLADLTGLAISRLPIDPLTGQSYQYYGTKSVAGDNVICSSEPCTGYTLIAAKENPETTTAAITILNGPGGTVVASSTASNAFASNVIYTTIAPVSTSSPATTTPPALIAGLGGSWTQVSLPGFKSQTWSGVAYGAGVYVAVGNTDTSAAVMTSTDGVTWTSRATPGSDQGYNLIAYGGGKFVAVSNMGYTMISSDGISWTRTTVPALAGGQGVGAGALAYGGAKFVVLVDHQSNSQAVYTSTDGVTWSPRNTPVNANPGTGMWSSITYDGIRFVATAAGHTGNEVMTSPDGITWTLQSTPTTTGQGMYAVACTVSRCVASYAVDFSTTGSLISTDGGVTWVTGGLAPANEYYYDAMTYASSTFVMVGAYGVLSSPDGGTWTKRSSSGQITSVTGGGPKFVTVSSNSYGTDAMTSTDAITWTVRITPKPVNWRSLSLLGNTYFTTNDYGGFASSIDGFSWTSLTSPAPSSIKQSWTRVAYGNGVYVTLAGINSGGNNLMTSTDGVNWTLRAMPSSKVADMVIFAGGKFVAGASGYTLTSTDGITWTINNSAALTTFWSDVAYGNGVYVATIGGSSGKIVTSTDGVTWSTPVSPSSRRAVTFDGTKFLSVGYYANNATSTNGSLWGEISGTDSDENSAVSYDGGGYVAASRWGDASYSVDGSTWTFWSFGHSDQFADAGLIVKNVGVNAYKVVAITSGYAWVAQ